MARPGTLTKDGFVVDLPDQEVTDSNVNLPDQKGSATDSRVTLPDQNVMRGKRHPVPGWGKTKGVQQTRSTRQEIAEYLGNVMSGHDERQQEEARKYVETWNRMHGADTVDLGEVEVTENVNLPEVTIPADYGEDFVGPKIPNEPINLDDVEITAGEILLTEGDVDKAVAKKQAAMRGRGRMAPSDPYGFIPSHLREVLAPKADGTWYPDGYPKMLREYMNTKQISPAVAGKLMNMYKGWKNSSTGAEIQAQRLDNLAKQQHTLALTGVADAQTEGQVALKDAIERGIIDQKRATELRNQYVQQWDDEMRAGMDSYNEAVETLKAQKMDAFGGSSFARAMGALAVAMGGIGASQTGGPNRGLEIVSLVMEKNLRAQEAEMSKNKAVISSRGNSLAFFRQHFGDMDRALEATRIQMLEQMKMQLGAVQTGTHGTLAQKRKAVLLAGLDEKQKAFERHLYAQTKAIAEQRAAMRLKMSMARRKTKRPGLILMDPEKAKYWSERYSTTLGGYVMGSADPKKLDERFAKIREAKQVIGRLRATYANMDEMDKFSGVTDMTKTRLYARLQRDLTNAKDTFRRGVGAAGEPGHEAMDKGFREVSALLTTELGPTDFMMGRVEDSIEHLDQVIGTAEGEVIKEFGASQVQPGMAPEIIMDDEGNMKAAIRILPISSRMRQQRFEGASEAVNVLDRPQSWRPIPSGKK